MSNTIIIFPKHSILDLGPCSEYACLKYSLKVQSCKLYNNKYLIDLTQIKNTEIFQFIAVLVYKLLIHKFLFINRGVNRNSYKVPYFLTKLQISHVNYCKIINSRNGKFAGYF